MLKVIILFTSLLLFLINPTDGNKYTALSDNHITPLSLYNCEEEGFFDATLVLKTINDYGDKALDLIVNLEETLDGEYTIILNVDSKTNEEWKNVYNYQGGICEAISSFVDKAWEKMKSQSTPVVTALCEIEPGHYEVLNFEVNTTDINIPTSLIGRFKSKLSIINSRGELCVCKILELEISPKSTF